MDDPDAADATCAVLHTVDYNCNGHPVSGSDVLFPCLASSRLYQHPYPLFDGNCAHPTTLNLVMKLHNTDTPRADYSPHISKQVSRPLTKMSAASSAVSQHQHHRGVWLRALEGTIGAETTGCPGVVTLNRGCSYAAVLQSVSASFR